MLGELMRSVLFFSLQFCTCMVSFPATRVISKYFCGEIVKTYCSIAKPVGKPQFYFEFNSVE